MQSDDARRPRRPLHFWFTPAVAVVGGVAYFVAGMLGGDRTFAIGGLGVMLGTAVVLLIASRVSDTVAGLLDRRDERINSIDGQATTFSGLAMGAAVLIGFIVEIAQGQDGQPYSLIGFIGGVSYVAALLVLRYRR